MTALSIPVPAPRRSAGVLAIDAARLSGTFLLTVAIAALALCVVPAMVGGPRPVLVESGSMSPAVRPGDVVLMTDPVRERLLPGAIVTFRSETGGLVTHRLVSTDDAGRWLTRGDANPTDDSSLVERSRIVGAGVLVVPFIGRPALWWSSGQWAPLVALGVLVAVAFGGALLPPRRRQRRRADAPVVTS